jgi:hypothetical protein
VSSLNAEREREREREGNYINNVFKWCCEPKEKKSDDINVASKTVRLW